MSWLKTAESDAITGLVGTPSDYAKEDNWMAIPEITHKVDTFYLYPTCYTDDSEGAKPICDIDNEAVRIQAQAIYYCRTFPGLYYDKNRSWGIYESASGIL